jgi:ABC-type branched-subunit amino acid transport system permease subunit
MRKWIFSEPAVAQAVLVWVLAGLVLPLWIGCTGAPLRSLIFYLAAAAALLSAADALNRQDCRPRWRELVYEWLLTTLGLAVPAAIAFSVGIAADHADGIAKADARVTIGSTASFALFASKLEDHRRLTND